ncbi:hypothetical protein ncot_12495 [Nocardioides sp. JQ2195]|uniref:hypothetical protein n=1 Tax=Nocardioides sp. JQ2195 TaxID=2592334 RepID=UPI00143E57DC|nr:hypothetical protein [Nocardioides sp. JQ2195]QIX27329.1 hypothetical protein ncot_12495 [Nocardioides sp. JQ2195]
MNSRASRLASLALVAAVALAGCGGDDEGDKKDGSSANPSSSSSAPDDGLTEPGSSLGLGEPATFLWQPNKKTDGEAEIAVTRIDKASVKAFSGFKLSDEMKKSTPYYVHLKVTNTGKPDLGGFEPPVFLDNGSSILYPAAHINGFAPCSNRTLPAKFRTGRSAQLCMVFLAPAKTELKTVALRPDEALEQIDWTGDLTRPGEKVGKKSKGKKR